MVNLLVPSLALVGLALSWYIYHKKKRGEKLVCLIGEDCDRVVKSRYNKLLGIPNEVFGMLYFGLVPVVELLLFFGVTTLAGLPLMFLLVFSAGIAVAFSFLLLAIQAFVLREWCEYCLVSTVVSVLIFALELL